MTKRYFVSSICNIEIEMTLNQARNGSHRGQCNDQVRALSLMPEIAAQLVKIDREDLIDELTEYGAWANNELQDHSENLQRILWIAAWGIVEQEFQNTGCHCGRSDEHESCAMLI